MILLQKKLLPLLLFFSILCLPCTSFAKNAKTILVSNDFIEVLGQSLVTGTDIKIVRAIPPIYTSDGHANYLKNHKATFEELAKNADAAVFASAFWPADPLYSHARRANIRIVPVDIAHPLDNLRAGIPITEFPEGVKDLHYIWTSPGNCARMSDILAADLAKLFPTDAEKITANLTALKRALFKLRTEYEVAFGNLEAFEAIGFTTDFIYLTDDFSIDMVDFVLTPEHKMGAQELKRLGASIEDMGIKCVFAKWVANEKVMGVVKDAGAKVVVLTSFKKGEEDATKQLLAYYQTNLELLLKGLSE